MSDRPNPAGYPSDAITAFLSPIPRDLDDAPTRPIVVSPRRTDRMAAAPCTMTLASPRSDFPEVPGYRLLGRLGRGGMGVVYRAVHLALNRPVALKMLGGSAFQIDPEVRARFRKEAEALASLRHTNIVPVYEVGEADGLPYFTMELVEGGDLAKHILCHPPKPAEGASIASQLARGVQAAHEAGILHRDLKPSNILLTSGSMTDSGGSTLKLSGPVPKIADFGLAKRFGLARGDDQTVTQAGDILGTPSYMAPEQAEGHGATFIGPGTDVYSLGAILFEMLTRRPPFDAGDPVRTVLQVLHEEPPAPSKLAPDVPRDLETICLKCLEKEARKRYATAGALADDLDRYLAGRPIAARPVSTIERAWKWARRRPGTAGLLGTTALAILVALFGITTMWHRANERADREHDARTLADERGEKLESQRQEIEYRLARGYVERGVAACREGDVPRGLILIAEALARTELLAAEATVDSDRERYRHLDWLARANLSRWAGRMALRPRAKFATDPRNPDRAWISDVDLSPDGQRAVTVSGSGRVRFFNAETNEETGPPVELGNMTTQASFSADGRRLLVTILRPNGTRAQVIDVESRTLIGPEIQLGGWLQPVRIFKDPVNLENCAWVGSDRIAAQSEGGVIRTLQVETGHEAGPAIRSDVPIASFLAAEDGKIAFTGHKDGSVRKWDVATGRELARSTPGTDFTPGLSMRPDGRRVLAAQWNGAARELDATTLAQIGSPFGPGLKVGADQFVCMFAADYGPDGTVVGFGGGTWTPKAKARVGFAEAWDPASGRPIHKFPFATPIWSLAFGGDGATLVAAEEQMTLHVASLQDGSILESYAQWGNPAKVLVGRDGKSVFAAERGVNAAPLLADLGPAALAGPALALGLRCNGMMFSRNGETLRAIRQDCRLQEFAVKTGLPVGPPAQLIDQAEWIKPLTDPRAAVICLLSPQTKQYRHEIFDPTTGAMLGKVNGADFLEIESFRVRSGFVAVTRNGNKLWAFNGAGEKLWEQALEAPIIDRWPLLTAVMPGDQAILVGQRHLNRMFELEAETGRVRGESWELPARIHAMNAHPTKQYVVIVFDEGYARVFDRTTRRPAGAPIPWSATYPFAMFSPDGKTLALMGELHGTWTAAFFDPVTGIAVGPPIQSKDRISNVLFHPSSHSIAIGHNSGTVRVWNLPEPVTGSSSRTRTWTEMVSRREFVAFPDETLTHLDDRGVGARRKKLRESGSEH